MSTETDYLDLPDDVVMKMSTPVAAAPATDVVETVQTETPDPVVETAAVVTETVVETVPATEVPATTATTETATTEVVASTTEEILSAADDAQVPATKPAEAAKPADTVVPGSEAKPADTKPATEVPATTATTETTTTELAKPATTPESLYERIISKPIKANGKDFQIKDEDEAVRLVQMGLNYTKKMQAVQPVLRVAKMLENNGLMDEGKLAYLVDLAKGDPAAINKLLADTKFDPLHVDADKAATYVPGNHQVSDTEMQFGQALEEAQATPAGQELIKEVAGQWDADSKRILYQEPALVGVLEQQKANGLYARIASEIDRQRTLGQLPANMPFLMAYKQVGDALHAAGQLLPPAEVTPPATATTEVPAAVTTTPVVETPAAPVATRVVTPPVQVSNTDRARAASPTKQLPASAVVAEPNYLDMPDDDFLKSVQGRV